MKSPAREMVPVIEQVEADQAMTGWRCWFVLPHEHLLRPIVMRGVAWKPRQAFEAICPETTHTPPADDCKCGIWAVLEPDQLKEIAWAVAPPDGLEQIPGRLVVGQVSLWGRLLQHDRGWRSSHGYPKHLYVFTQDATVAAGLRDAYLVPVEYGEKATLLRGLLPSPHAEAPARAPARSAPSSQPAAARHPKDILLAAIAKLPPGSLKSRVTSVLDGQAWRLHWAATTDRDRVADEKESLAKAQACLEHAVQRGGYYLKSYGDAWKTVLMREVKACRLKVSLATGVRRAVKGDRAAARRLVWWLLAERWRDTEALYRDTVHHLELMRRKRNRSTGAKLSAATLGQRESRRELLYRRLNDHLADLAEIPTPSYREWRRMLGK